MQKSWCIHHTLGILFILSFSGRNHAACKTRMSTRTTAPIMKIMTRSYYYFYFMSVKVHIAGIPISELQDLPWPTQSLGGSFHQEVTSKRYFLIKKKEACPWFQKWMDCLPSQQLQLHGFARFCQLCCPSTKGTIQRTQKASSLGP